MHGAEGPVPGSAKTGTARFWKAMNNGGSRGSRAVAYRPSGNPRISGTVPVPTSSLLSGSESLGVQWPGRREVSTRGLGVGRMLGDAWVLGWGGQGQKGQIRPPQPTPFSGRRGPACPAVLSPLEKKTVYMWSSPVASVTSFSGGHSPRDGSNRVRRLRPSPRGVKISCFQPLAAL